jgi:hypothetical protein
MGSANDYPAVGKVIEVGEGEATLSPTGSEYELVLCCADAQVKAGDDRLRVTVHAVAERLWTVPAGGNFVTPIRGTPRVIQGRVICADARQLVVQAGLPVLIDLPREGKDFNLAAGPLAVGARVNVLVQPRAELTVLGAAGA